MKKILNEQYYKLSIIPILSETFGFNEETQTLIKYGCESCENCIFYKSNNLCITGAKKNKFFESHFDSLLRSQHKIIADAIAIDDKSGIPHSCSSFRCRNCLFYKEKSCSYKVNDWMLEWKD